MTVGAAPLEPLDWLSETWNGFPERWEEVLTRRLNRETLDGIGEELKLSRERVRQLQQKAELALVGAQQVHFPGLPLLLSELLGARPAVPESEIAELVPTATRLARDALIQKLGASHPTTWAGELADQWSLRSEWLDKLLAQLVALAPMTDSELLHAKSDLGLSAVKSIDELLKDPKSKLTHRGAGWVRRGRVPRDIAYLWLRSEGEPREAIDIAAVSGNSERAIRETMRRDADFSQVRPDGTWALTDWRLPAAESGYSSAVEVVVEVLRERGALTFEELLVGTQQRYPVSTWRVRQCLSSELVGLTGAGLYDLAERGAVPIEDEEPKRPTNVQVRGDVLGVELTVDRDMLRGSGLGVNRWVTWYLNLRTAPSTRYFQFIDHPGEVTVRRATSSSQLSSLRAVASELGVVDGCKLTVLFHLSSDTASVRHTCVGGCPQPL